MNAYALLQHIEQGGRTVNVLIPDERVCAELAALLAKLNGMRHEDVAAQDSERLSVLTVQCFQYNQMSGGALHLPAGAAITRICQISMM